MLSGNVKKLEQRVLVTSVPHIWDSASLPWSCDFEEIPADSTSERWFPNLLSPVSDDEPVT